MGKRSRSVCSALLAGVVIQRIVAIVPAIITEPPIDVLRIVDLSSIGILTFNPLTAMSARRKPRATADSKSSIPP